MNDSAFNSLHQYRNLVVSVRRLSFEQLQRDGAFALLGRLFSDRTSCLALLENAGVPAESVPVPGSLAPAAFWRDTCREISKGGFPCDLEKLLRTAHDWYPANTELLGILSGGGVYRVLCMLSSPSNGAHLRLDVEHRTIREVSGSSRNVEVTVLPATRIRDVVPALLARQPDVVHFSGHGTRDGKLVFENDDGMGEPLPADVLAHAFGVLDDLRCVLLNSCFAAGYADALLERAGVVIGSASPLGDRCATAFATGFYTALGLGGSLRRAYDAGLAEMHLRRCPTDSMRMLERQAR